MGVAAIAACPGRQADGALGRVRDVRSWSLRLRSLLLSLLALWLPLLLLLLELLEQQKLLELLLL